MLFIAKPRYKTNEDGTVTDLAPQGARMNDSVYLSHIELTDASEGAILGTDEDELLSNPLVQEKVDLVEIANAILADLEG